MTNPAAAIKMLITYAICIPLAILVGYLLTNPLDYGTLGFLGLVIALIISPVFIKWHYPIMVFGLSAPIVCFFLVGRPPMAQVVVILSLTIAIVERAINSEHRFIKASAMTWPLLFLTAVIVLTMKLTGGMQLHTLDAGSGGGGGGKKYIVLFVGIASYFALTSRPIPAARRRLYVALFFLSGLLAFIGDLFPYLPSPFNYINLLIPPTSGTDSEHQVAIVRLGAFAGAAGAAVTYMLARYGLRGIFLGNRLWRAPLFLCLLTLTLFGGFRVIVIGFTMQVTLMFFLERLHRTRLLMVFGFGAILATALLVPFAKQLPTPFQRAISFLPLELDTTAKMDAEGSAQWRYQIWRDTWPKVPQYLLLGKGYFLTADDYAMIGTGTFANGIAATMDMSEQSLAISGDYHNGPLSTLMPFGIWGGIGMLWLMGACLWVHFRSYKYGVPELKVINTLLLALCIQHIITYLFIIGAFSNDVGSFAQQVGFCIALNGGVVGPVRQAVAVQRFKPLAAAQPA